MPVARGLFCQPGALAPSPLRRRKGDTRATSPPRGNREPGIEAPNELNELKRELKAEARAAGLMSSAPRLREYQKGGFRCRSSKIAAISWPACRWPRAAGVLGARRSLADEPPPETTTIRLNWYPNICLAPKDIAEDLLRAEGFTDIRYVRNLPIGAVASGEIDFDFDTAAWVVSHLDAGEPILALAGVHSGCYELFAHEPIRAISDLKGKKRRHL